ncbi:hypothetical protein RB195_008765 [Necator americanus]|uniref:Reverse transcriptase domain-containing protein n=1 Tax=Necator americanus TaxID=51031 RepID=A0ABR1CTK2_NECAM
MQTLKLYFAQLLSDKEHPFVRYPKTWSFDLAGLKPRNVERNSVNECRLDYESGREWTMLTLSLNPFITLQTKRFRQEKPGEEKRRRMRHQLKHDRGNEWMSGAKKFEKAVRQEAVTRLFLFNFAVDDIMRRTPVDVVIAPYGRPFVYLEYVDDGVIFASNNAKLQRVVDVVSKLAAAYGL